MFLGLPDPHPDPLFTSTDPDPSIINNSKKIFNFYCFVTSYDFLPMFRIRMFLVLPDPHPDALARGRLRIRGSGSAFGSVPKFRGSKTLLFSFFGKKINRKDVLKMWNRIRKPVVF
jgi:hypothetical protein